MRIDRGYHSYIEDPRAYIPSIVDLKTSVFIIPKGARYYKGGINDKFKVDGYVSDRILYVGTKDSWWTKLYLTVRKKIFK